MTRRRFFAPPNAFTAQPNTLTLPSSEGRHLRDVLRLERGDEAFVFDGEGKEYQCIVRNLGRNLAELEVVAEVDPARPESPLHLSLAVSLLKGEKFDLVVQKTTELGVNAILPVLTRLADVRLREQSDVQKRVERWQRIALEAAKQSGRAFVPKISVPASFAKLIETTPGATETRLMFSERDGQTLAKATEDLQANVFSITALVGSEGGWTDQEIVAARDFGWRIVTLGGRTVRAETAAIAIAALLQHRFGDLK